MPAQIASAITSYFFGSAAGSGLGAAFGTSLAAGLTYGATYVAATYALVEGSKAFLKDDIPPEGPKSVNVPTSGGATYKRHVLGEAWANGHLVYANSKKQSDDPDYDFYILEVFNAGEVEAITNLMWEDDLLDDAVEIDWGINEVTAGAWYKNSEGNNSSAAVYRSLGTSSQSAPAFLTSAFPADWDTQMRGRGYAWVGYWFRRFPNSEEIFAGGPPQPRRALVQGHNNVVDPSSSPHTTGWSDNPVLLAAWYMTELMGFSSDRMDWDFIATEAAYCDELVPVPPAASPENTQKRYTFNGVISEGVDHETNLGLILGVCLGHYAKVGGKWRIYAGQYRTPTVTLDETDIVGPIQSDTAAPRVERFNRISGTYLASEQGNVAAEFPIRTDAGLEARDDGNIIRKKVDLIGVKDQYQAQRIAEKMLQQTNRQKTVTVPVKFTGVSVTPGTYVQLSYDKFGWANKVFECLGWRFNPLGGTPVELILREDDASWWPDPTVAEYQTRAETGEITGGVLEISPPTGVTVTSKVGGIHVSIAQDDDLGDFSSVRVYGQSTNTWGSPQPAILYDGKANEVDIELAADETRYIWVRNMFRGIESDRFPDADVSTLQGTSLAEGIVSSLFGSLYAHFLMDSASFIPDLTGDNDAAVIGGSPSLEKNAGPGGVGSAIRFDEDTEHALLMDDATADGVDPRAGGSAWSMSLWFNSDEENTGNANTRIINRDPSDFWGLLIDQSLAHGAQTVEFQCNDSSDGGTITVGNATLFGDEHWHHVVVTVTSAGLVSMYVDDAFIDDSGADVYAPVGEVSPQEDRPIVVANDTEAVPATGAFGFNGRVYDVRFFTKVLSLSEIHSLFTYPYAAGVTPPVGLDSANLQYNSRFQIDDPVHERPAGTWMAGGSSSNLIRTYMDDGQKVMSIGGINGDNVHDVTLSPFPLNDAKQYRVRVTARHLGAENSPQASTIFFSMSEYDSDLLENELGISTGATPIPANGWDDAHTVAQDRRTIISSAAPDWESREWPATWTTEEAVYIPTVGAQYAAFRIDNNDGNNTTGGRLLVALVEIFEEAIDTDALVDEAATVVDNVYNSGVGLAGSGGLSPLDSTPWIDILTSSSVTPHQDGSPLIVNFDGKQGGKFLGASIVRGQYRIVDITTSPWTVLLFESGVAHEAGTDSVTSVAYNYLDSRSGTDARQYRVQGRPQHNGALGMTIYDVSLTVYELKK